MAHGAKGGSGRGAVRLDIHGFKSEKGQQPPRTSKKIFGWKNALRGLLRFVCGAIRFEKLRRRGFKRALRQLKIP